MKFKPTFCKTAEIGTTVRVFGLLAALCLASNAEAVGDAANGKVLYNTTNGAPLACSGCHGANPSSGMSKILNGANNGARIMGAIGSNVGGMGFLSGYVSAAQADDIGAYIANPNAAAPVATVSPAATVSPTSIVLEQGWNLLGNNFKQALAAAQQFNDQNIASVWKWDSAANIWQFYTPSLTTAALDTYAPSKGFGVLGQINPGEGYWVNASARITLPVQASSGAVSIQSPPGVGVGASGTTSLPVTSPTSLTVAQGWSLLGNNFGQPLAIASQFNNQNIESVWKWDIVNNSWQFYTPLLTASALQTYAAGKGFGVLGQINPGEGYWLNARAGITLPIQINVSSNNTAMPAIIIGHEGSEIEGSGHEGGGREGGEGGEGGGREGGGREGGGREGSGHDD